MVISSCSRQCILKLKEHSVKKTNSLTRLHSQLSSGIEAYHDNDNSTNNPTIITPLVSKTSNNNNNLNIITNQLNDKSVEIIQDRSLLGRLLNCKPCRQVTENQKNKNVCSIKKSSFYFIIK
jgi:hypothetical protein